MTITALTDGLCISAEFLLVAVAVYLVDTICPGATFLDKVVLHIVGIVRVCRADGCVACGEQQQQQYEKKQFFHRCKVSIKTITGN